MKKHMLKRHLSLLLAVITVFSSSALIFADEIEEVEEIPVETEIVDETQDDEETPAEIVDETVAEEETVIIDEADIEEVTVEEIIVDEEVIEIESADAAPVVEAEEVLNGWVQDGSNWYYYVDGEKVSGWKKIGGSWYYFDEGIFSTHYMYVKDCI